MRTHHVYLVPGFFGFANFGELVYFSHVREYLGHYFETLGENAQIHRVPTDPTASLRARAERLLQAVRSSAGDEGPIHLVGHSSGGLDARLMVTPGVVLDHEVEPWAARVRSVVTVATPHRGTPTADFFNSLFGRSLLQLFSLATIHVLRFGHVPISVLARFSTLLTRRLRWMRRDVMDQLYDQLLSDFSPERRAELDRFLASVGEDRALLSQLAPDNIDLFNAAAPDRPGVRYGCVVTRGRRPTVASFARAGRSAYGLASHGAYAAFHRMAATGPQLRPTPVTPEQLSALAAVWRHPLDPTANDGMVPTLSQLWGTVIRAADADHLDVIGHFDDPGHEPPHYDWLRSATRFDRRDFDAIWSAVADFIVES